MFILGTLALSNVWIGTVLAAVSASAIGTLTLLQQKPLAGDAISHALLPGLCIAFWIVGEKSMVALLMGAFLAGMLAFWTLDTLPRWSKIKQDTATALVLSLFFGVGLLLLTHIQHSGNAQQVGLQHFLFGNAASIQRHDILVFTVMAVILLLALSLLFRGFKTLIFDKSFASAIGYPVATLAFLLRILLVIAVIVGMHSVGIVLMTAMLVTPAAAARFWTERLHRMLTLSASFAALSATTGTLFSYQVTRLPTGPCIVLAMATIALLSFIAAPKKGFIAKKWAKYRYRNKIVQENVLKLLYTLRRKQSTPSTHTLAQLLVHYPLSKQKMLTQLHILANQELVSSQGGTHWSLTKKGMKKGKKVHRLHLLWEAYLMRYLHLAPDHVHEDAESMEHLLTPALCAELETLVGDKISK